MSLLYIFCSSESQITLYKEKEACPSHEVTFVCITSDEPATFWEVIKGINRVQFNFNTNFDSIGMIKYGTIKSSSLKAEIISGNISSSTSRLTIYRSLHLVSAIIICNEKEVHFNIIGGRKHFAVLYSHKRKVSFENPLIKKVQELCLFYQVL